MIAPPPRSFAVFAAQDDMYTPRVSDAGRDLTQRAISALIWIAAFCFATGIFLSSTLLLRGLSPTPHVAVGRVTIENVSKARDYAAAVLFFLIVPAATVVLHRYGVRIDQSLRRAAPVGQENLVSLLFVTPFFLAPFLYLTITYLGTANAARNDSRTSARPTL